MQKASKSGEHKARSFLSSSFRRRVVVITGASAGIGRAAACEFAKHGWAVGLIARGKDGLEGARLDVEELGGKPLPAVSTLVS
jgi:NADP-dependent 3-hydroxy acid dehydrogenase YdfG